MSLKASRCEFYNIQTDCKSRERANQVFLVFSVVFVVSRHAVDGALLKRGQGDRGRAFSFLTTGLRMVLYAKDADEGKRV